jgi:hypothetical protein
MKKLLFLACLLFSSFSFSTPEVEASLLHRGPRLGILKVKRKCAAEFVGRSRRRKVFFAKAVGFRGTGVKRRACRKAIRKCRNHYPRRAHKCVRSF